MSISNPRLFLPVFTLATMFGCDAQFGASGGQNSPGIQAAANSEFFAISPDQRTFNEQQAFTLKALGAGMIRLEFNGWPDNRDALDRAVDAALAADLKVLAELNYTMLPAPDDPVARVQYWHESFDDSSLSAANPFAAKFIDAAGEIAEHFEGRVSFYEIWNEPNAAVDEDTRDWDGACGAYVYQRGGEPGWGLCPRQLAVITAGSYDAIGAQDSAARIVAGNLLYHGAEGWVGQEYWEEVEKSPVARAYKLASGTYPWDIVGFHPYGQTGTRLSDEVADYQAILDRWGDDADLAITEYGWTTDLSSEGEVHDTYSTIEDMPNHVREDLTTLAESGVAFVMWFNYLRDPGLSFGMREVRRLTDPATNEVRSYPGLWKTAVANAFCEITGATNCPTKHRQDGWLDVDGAPDTIEGWAYDPQENEPLVVDIHVNGVKRLSVAAKLEHGGLVLHQVAPSDMHGFRVPVSSLQLGGGTHVVSARAHGSAPGYQAYPLQGSRTITVDGTAPPPVEPSCQDCAPLDASPVGISLSGVTGPLSPGQSFNASIIMRNEGAQAWTFAEQYKLGSIDPIDNLKWGVGRIALAPDEIVVPGALASFSATFTAPLTPGSYTFRWRMLQEGVAWFGSETNPVTLQVQ